MAKEQESKKAETQTSQALKDLIALAAIVAIVLLLSYYFDIFVLIVHFLEDHPDKVSYVDEVIMGLVTLSVGLAIFAWRRWIELKKETAERIKHQEELLKLATTQADVERIISKQLRFDMDQLKQDVREIYNLLASKLKR